MIIFFTIIIIIVSKLQNDCKYAVLEMYYFTLILKENKYIG